mmetsp:Transcript_30560/g.81318  ORF Transcript_30560/g.81318 Transcript_30560/m.81318 type:complete len:164 (-) Transcript_30560:34-525(-)
MVVSKTASRGFGYDAVDIEKTYYGRMTVSPVVSNPIGLVGVFTYSFGMVITACILCVRSRDVDNRRNARGSGLRQWWWLLVLTLGTTMGQPLTSSTAWLPFHVFGSNFLEQVLIGATVLADWFVNEGKDGWMAQLRLEAIESSEVADYMALNGDEKTVAAAAV